MIGTYCVGNNSVILPDGRVCPCDLNNPDYQEFIAWEAAGNVANFLPTSSIPEIISQFETVIQARLDLGAKNAGYDSILSACSYAAAPNAFQADGISFINWRANCWTYCYSIMQQVQIGAIALPTVNELISNLPKRI